MMLDEICLVISQFLLKDKMPYGKSDSFFAELFIYLFHDAIFCAT